LKQLLVIFLLLECVFVRAQIHSIGLGASSSVNKEIRIEGAYTFNFKLLYLKVNYSYNGRKERAFDSYQQVGTYVGIQSLSDYKLIGHLALGPRYFMPKNNNDYDARNTHQAENQINFFLISGATFNVIKNHSLYFDVFIGGYKSYDLQRNGESLMTHPDIFYTFGYSFFINPRKIKQ
jgi:hypothetical protein